LKTTGAELGERLPHSDHRDPAAGRVVDGVGLTASFLTKPADAEVARAAPQRREGRVGM